MSEKKKSNRFDYVAYDDESKALQEEAKSLITQVETFINEKLGGGRYQALAHTASEEIYAWIGKAVRDKQASRGGDTAHQPARSAE